MSLSPDILNELTALAPHLASRTRQVAFTVPDGVAYFSQLPVQILKAASNSSLPEPILNINPAQNAFVAPERYFSQLPQQITDIAANSADIEPILSSDTPKHAFAAPHGYFDILSSGIVAAAKASEMPEPVLSHNEQLKNNPYEAPYLYFDKLPERVLARIHAEQPVSIWVRVKNAFASSGYAKMALGAVMMAVISIGAWTWYQPGHHYVPNNPVATSPTDNADENTQDLANVDDIYNNLTDEQINTVLANINPSDSSILNVMDLQGVNLNDGANL